MAIESKRGCGYRKVGGMYLVGSGLTVACDRLPLEITTCPVCDCGIKFTRAPTKINAAKLWGKHLVQGSYKNGCACYALCYVCDPPDGVSYLMGVGDQYYTPQEFITEAQSMGVCKRIGNIPKDLKLGVTVIYLAHNKAIYAGRLDGKELYKPAVFYAFRPHRIEKLIWKSQDTAEYRKDLEKRGIAPVVVPDGDKDHA